MAVESGAACNIGTHGLQEAAATIENWLQEGNKGLPELEYLEFSSELASVLASLAALKEMG